MQSNARDAALEVLEKCRRNGAWSSAAIDGAIKKYGLDARDAALAARLCLEVMQNFSLLDYYIGLFCNQKLEPKVRDILRLGACQLLLFDRIPARAAVSESVALCARCGCGRASGLVNAVLRKLAAGKDALPDVEGAGTAKYLSVRYSVPQWLAEAIIAEQGYAFAEEFFACCAKGAPLTIQVNTLKISAEGYSSLLSGAGIEHRLRPECAGCIELAGGTVPELPGYNEGYFYVQDRAARIAADILGLQSGMKVIDLCASPGGKSFAAAIAMKNRGEILACDIHEKKLALVRSGAERLGIGIIGTRAADARVTDDSLLSSADAVIADVPCSGFGVMAKKPEIRLKTDVETAKLPEIQRAILENAANYVKPGGALLYSTCTVLERENRAVTERFLESHGDFRYETFSAGGISSADGAYTFWPNVDGTDGFFAALLRRKL